LYDGLFVRVKLTVTVFGLTPLQGLLPPVHAEAAIDTTFVAAVVLTVGVPEQGVNPPVNVPEQV
jgi:hypothetical protein